MKRYHFFYQYVGNVGLEFHVMAQDIQSAIDAIEFDLFKKYKDAQLELEFNSSHRGGVSEFDAESVAHFERLSAAWQDATPDNLPDGYRVMEHDALSVTVYEIHGG